MRAFVGCEAVKQPPDVSPERVDGARGGLAEPGFECGKQLFDGIQIGGVGREIAEVCPYRFNSLFDARHFVTAQVVSDNEIARVTRQAQTLLDILEE